MGRSNLLMITLPPFSSVAGLSVSFNRFTKPACSRSTTGARLKSPHHCPANDDGVVFIEPAYLFTPAFAPCAAKEVELCMPVTQEY